MTTRFEFALLFALASAAPVAAPMAAMAQAAADWNQTYADTGKGHRVGDAAAPVQLVEFVSYTCPHCAHYAATSEGTLRLGYVGEGKAAVEVRHVIRNQIDLAAALVTECGAPERFFDRHRTMLLAQGAWLAKAQTATEAQQARWRSGTMGQRMQAIAGDLDFYELMEPQGLGAAELDRCLADGVQARAIFDRSQANSTEFAIAFTPSFVINGVLQPGVDSWQALQPLLDRPAGS